MKKRLLAILLAVLMIFSLLPVTALATGEGSHDLTGFAGGNGEATTPYEIATKDQLENLATIVNGGNNCENIYFKLTVDIGSSTTPVTTRIGDSSNLFKGHFDGADHTVTLAIDLPTASNVGLFGNLGTGGEIKNVNTAGSVKGSADVGGVCGYNDGGMISGCSNAAAVEACTTSTAYVGGICGCCKATDSGVTAFITDCTNSGSVTSAGHSAGGICGYCSAGSGSSIIVRNCMNSGSVTSAGLNAGGICGVNGTSSQIVNCGNLGSVTSTHKTGRVGGVCGFNSSTITNCFSSGTVSGSNNVGGVCGYSNGGSVTNCFYNSETAGCTDAAATGLTTAVMTAPTETTGALIDLLNGYITTNSTETVGWTTWLRSTSGCPGFTLVPDTHSHGTGGDAVSFEKEIKTLSDLQELFTNGGSGYLANNITATAGLTVSKDVSLCLNGKVLDLDGKGNINVSNGATFNLYDCDTKTVHNFGDTDGLWTWDDTLTGEAVKHTVTGGIITGGVSSGNGGGISVSGTFNMYGGNIVGNQAAHGGGVCVNGGTFTMSGGTIVGNVGNANKGTGGGVFVKGGMFTMSGGTIRDNTAMAGGGIRMSNSGTVNMYGGTILNNTAANTSSGDGGGGLYVDGNSSFNMYGGEISGNTAYACGGGVYVSSNSSITMTGGKITGNIAKRDGGGVLSNGTFNLGGTAQVTGNTAGETDSVKTDNVYLKENKTIALGTGTGEGGNGIAVPETGFAVGVTTATAPTEAAPVKFTINGASTDTDYFTPDKADYEVKYNTDHLELAVKPVTHGFTVTKDGVPVAEKEGVYQWFDNKLQIYTSGLTVSGTTATEYIDVVPEVETLTLNGVKIIPTDENMDFAIRFNGGGATVNLVGENVFGNAVNYNEETKASDYKLKSGIKCVYGSLTFTGAGNLTIYDQEVGIQTLEGDVTFDESFSGKLTVEDYGYFAPGCAISASGNVSLLGGTFDLTSYESNGIYAYGNIDIKDADVTVNTYGQGIEIDSLSVGKNVTIDGSKIKVTTHGNGSGIDVPHGDVTIKNSTAEINASEEDSGYNVNAIYAYNVNIVDSVVTATAKTKAVDGMESYGDATGILACTGLNISGDKSDVSITAECDKDSYGVYSEGAVSILDGKVRIKADTAILSAGEDADALIIGSAANLMEIKNAKIVTAINGETWEYTGSELITEGAGGVARNIGGDYYGLLVAADTSVEDGYVVIQPKAAPAELVVFPSTQITYNSDIEAYQPNNDMSIEVGLEYDGTEKNKDDVLTKLFGDKASLFDATGTDTETEYSGTPHTTTITAKTGIDLKWVKLEEDGSFKYVVDGSYNQGFAITVKWSIVKKPVQLMLVDINPVTQGTDFAFTAANVVNAGLIDGHSITNITYDVISKADNTSKYKATDPGTGETNAVGVYTVQLTNVTIQDDSRKDVTANYALGVLCSQDVNVLPVTEFVYYPSSYEANTEGDNFHQTSKEVMVLFVYDGNEKGIDDVLKEIFGDEKKGLFDAVVATGNEKQTNPDANYNTLTVTPKANTDVRWITPEMKYVFDTDAANGSPSFAITVKWTITKANQTAPAAGEGYTIDRENGKIIPKEGYEIRAEIGKFDTKELPLRFDVPYFVRKAETDTLNPSPETEFTVILHKDKEDPGSGNDTPVAPVTPAPTSPKTGDNSHIYLWLAVAFGSLLAGGLLLIKQRREEK